MVSWFSSYLSDRKQCLSMNGVLYQLMPVDSGVPQGSILGPLLYLLFTNELPTLVVDDPKKTKENICCYADDSTLTVIDSDHTNLSRKLTEKYEIISEFMRDNRLMLNTDKTHLVVMASSQSRYRSQSANLVAINTGIGCIKPVFSQKILGCHVQNDLKWTQHIRDSEDDLL